MTRWNAAVDAVPSQGFDFHWNGFEQFPHPTFKGGSAEAYRAFAAVLLAFFRWGDDFDFLAAHHLFTLHLAYDGAGGLETTFQMLAHSFSAPGAFGDIPPDTQQALAAIANRIDHAEAGGGVDPAPPPAPDTPPPAPPAPTDGGFAAMCRHYCEALHETTLYSCVSNGRGDAATCDALGTSADLCYQGRCGSETRVTSSLCLQQCDALRGQYDAVCGAASPPASLCPAASADHDAACRAGCGPQQ